MMSLDGWTDPEAVGKGLGSLGPTAAVLVCFILLVAFLLFGLFVFIAWWRGVERWGIVGFGREYQLTRIAHERMAAATEETKKDQGEIKGLLTSLQKRLEDVLERFLPSSPPTQREPRAAPHRASSPSLSDKASCTPQP